MLLALWSIGMLVWLLLGHAAAAMYGAVVATGLVAIQESRIISMEKRIKQLENAADQKKPQAAEHIATLPRNKTYVVRKPRKRIYTQRSG